ncbi:pseudouridylate synthase [Marinomonas sp. M1K-6]|uniref:tRNA pseudouridine synthase C n=1 Tax=Marinomonas profundi TaxID=2726122 RepID=A0A847R371_9GAMM|nr:pseudouridine synthase [Marinomonas profundi]NLQ16376.1 pseudouridylate synthase [Marinomonas profundi]UDV03050.1 pseudouridylate synthase [Marinomonas profundi]
MTLDILFQDEHLVVVNKPAGLLVHRTHLAKDEEDAVVQRLRDQTGKWVFPVHRLDRGTSGVLVMAFSPQVARLLAAQFSSSKTDKIYHCLVRGFCDEMGVIDYPLAKLNEQKGRSRFKIEGTERDAETHFTRLAQYQFPIPVSRYDSMRLSWLEVKPKQGRKHQIRRHFKHQHNPLVGDSCYGCRHINKVVKEIWPDDFRLMLHASSLQFVHPITHQTMTLKAQLSDKIVNVLSRLAHYQV